MTEILLSSSQRLLCVPVGEDAKNFRLHWHFTYQLRFSTPKHFECSIKISDKINKNAEAKILGIFSPPDGIDFEVENDWVGWYAAYKNYLKEQEEDESDTYTLATARESFISLLNQELSKVYPHKSNPVDKTTPDNFWPNHPNFRKDEFDEQIKLWSEAEKLVLPSRLLIILMK